MTRCIRNFSVHSFVHSNYPLNLALRKKRVQFVLFLIMIYYICLSALMLEPWYMETDALPLMSYRLVVTKLLNGSAAVAPNVHHFMISDRDCFSDFPISRQLARSVTINNTIVLEFDTKVRMDVCIKPV